MGTRADHTSVGNKLQPAVDSQGSSECDKNCSDDQLYTEYT